MEKEIYAWVSTQKSNPDFDRWTPINSSTGPPSVDSNPYTGGCRPCQLNSLYNPCLSFVHCVNVPFNFAHRGIFIREIK